MSSIRRFLFLLASLASLCLLSAMQHPAAQGQEPAVRQRSMRLMQQGNFKEALAGFRQLCLSEDSDPRLVANDLQSAVQCLQRLGSVSECDQLIEQTVKSHPKSVWLLTRAASQYLSLPKYGMMIDGEFQRGGRRGGGKVVNSLERDRVRGLQLLQQAIEPARNSDDKTAAGSMFEVLAQMLLGNRGPAEAWRLQYLTDLGKLPDYDDGYPIYRGSNGAPVDAEGQPVFHSAPKSWQAAQTDGERWRWALEQTAEYQPAKAAQIKLRRADFLRQQFGVETMRQFFRPFFGRMDGPIPDDGKQNESGPYAVETLKDGETIARLATGIKRITLPDEFNHIKIYREVAGEGGSAVPVALEALARVYQNRRQFPKAADAWREVIALRNAPNSSEAKTALAQIESNWGRFEPTMTATAGGGVELYYRFRNGRSVELVAQRIKIPQLLADIKSYLKSDPARLDWQKINLAAIGYRLVQRNETKYLGPQVAQWNEELEPRERHFDKRVAVQAPLNEPGAYLVTATMQGGNVNKIIVWVNDTAIVHKPLSGKNLYFIADSRTGKPVAGANVEFFGYRQKRIAGNKYQVQTSNFAETADADGLVMPDPRDLPSTHQWLVMARTQQGRLAYMGFNGIWSRNYYDQQYNQTKVFTITDRPVYRPGQKVQFKLWVRKAQYDQDDVSQFANQSFNVKINDPRGQELQTFNLRSDDYGGLIGEWEVPGDATLGQYRMQIPRLGGGTFRVEEYKKPEFEVSVQAPDEPVQLGERIKATIQAKYYFGSPVVEATVKYKVMRQQQMDDWYPIAPWDWCYGPGYWWFGYDAPWYPGWSKWVGCFRPVGWWNPGPRNPPELVMEVEAPIGADGTLEVEIDTALAAAMHADQDHKYTITAEVRDQSRRTIVGAGEVLVARKPFKIYTWLDRGYYQVGDSIVAHIKSQTPDRKGVAGEGVMRLFKIRYDDQRNPLETEVGRWDLACDSQGKARQQLRAAAAGQYRLSYQLTDAAGHRVEGGYLFTIIGADYQSEDFRFNHLELIPDKGQYAPGDTVKLQINTDLADSTILLFVRAANGVCLPPKVVRVNGKSVVETILVVKKDMPNFFIEAATVANGKSHSEIKEIVVPPEKRVLNVEVLPSSQEYLPGQEATIALQLTDHTGENFVGSTALTIYDKSLEYIAGGSNVPEIREFFWKWRRRHNSQQTTNLDWFSGPLQKPNTALMSDIGIFGNEIFEEQQDKAKNGLSVRRSARQLQGANMAMSRAGAPAAMESAMAADAAPMEGAAFGGAGSGADAAPAAVQPVVRTQFADTAFWSGAVTTDANGRAEVKLTMPENLTAWKVKVWAMGHGTKVGEGEAEVVTRQNLLVRLQAPRFFVQTDEVVLSANVHNYLPNAKDVTVVLETEGPLEMLAAASQIVRIEADGEARVDWRVKVRDEGTAVVRMKALTDEESDAMEMEFPCYIHGMLKTEAWAGTIRPDGEKSQLVINVPAQRKVEQTQLEIRYSPSLAGAMVDALPYLAEYPYGCTEQTLNRFLPAVITQQMLIEMGIDLEAVRDKRTNLNAQEIGDDRQRAKQWKRFDRNPVFDRAELDRIVRSGVKELTNMQNSDGGWGWFSGYRERSFAHTTAVVVHGLQVAQQNDVPLVPGVFERGVKWLKRYQDGELQKIKNYPSKTRPYKPHANNLDALAYMLLADAGQENAEMREFLYRDRTKLSVYAMAMFGLALEKQQHAEQLAMILRNIRQYLVVDQENETAYLKLRESSYWWYWYGSEIEANAYYLKLLSRVEPKSETSPRLVKYLLNNRKHATYWSSTRDTALCVEAFSEYLRASGELQPDMVVEIYVDGKRRKEVAITKGNLFTFDNRLLLVGDEVSDGSHQIEIRRRGTGPVYFNAYLTNFTLEDPITRAGLEVRVQRKYYRLIPEEKTIKAQGARGQAADQRVEKYRREQLANLAEVASGELVEVELVIDSKNDYEYLMFEDMKAAGFEPVDVRSGYRNVGLRTYMEMRDNRVTFFVRSLPRGKHSVAYRLRAEIPGRFSALPARAEAMYAPELRGNSDEIKLQIVDP